MKTNNTKSKITLVTKNLYTGEDEVVTLYDFTKVDHYFDGIKANYRVLCGNKFYYYQKDVTRIIEIEVY